MSNIASDSPCPEARPRRNRGPLIAGLIARPLVVAIGLIYYWVDWNAARADRPDQSSGHSLKAYQTFLENIEADRLEAAYRSTTASFRARVSQEVLKERARR